MAYIINLYKKRGPLGPFFNLKKQYACIFTDINIKYQYSKYVKSRSNNKHMATSNEILEKIKGDLLEKKEKVITELNSITKKDEHEKDDHRAAFPDYGDKIDENAQEINEYSTNLATERILESTLRDIDAALKRMDDGTYGICKYCKKDIGEKRLLARPVASTCIECKTKLQSL